MHSNISKFDSFIEPGNGNSSFSRTTSKFQILESPTKPVATLKRLDIFASTPLKKKKNGKKSKELDLEVYELDPFDEFDRNSDYQRDTFIKDAFYSTRKTDFDRTFNLDNISDSFWS